MIVNAFQPDELYLRETRTNKETGESQQVFAGGTPLVLSIAAQLMGAMVSAGQEPSAPKAINNAFALVNEYNDKYQELKRLQATAGLAPVEPEQVEE